MPDIKYFDKLFKMEGIRIKSASDAAQIAFDFSRAVLRKPSGKYIPPAWIDIFTVTSFVFENGLVDEIRFIPVVDLYNRIDIAIGEVWGMIEKNKIKSCIPKAFDRIWLCAKDAARQRKPDIDSIDILEHVHGVILPSGEIDPFFCSFN